MNGVGFMAQKGGGSTVPPCDFCDDNDDNKMTMIKMSMIIFKLVNMEKYITS